MIRLLQQPEFVVPFILVFIFVLTLYFKTYNNKPPTLRQFYALGTVIQLKAYGSKSNKAIEEATHRLNIIDDKMSLFKKNSEVSDINENAGISSCKVSEDTYFVVKKAVEYSKLSEGTFDPTIGPITSLWAIGTAKARIPDKTLINSALKLVNYKDIILNEKDYTVKLKSIGQKIDIGGIAKGYAADEVRNILKANKIKSALIDLGGNIFALGKKPDGTRWNIGVQNPFDERGESIGFISVEDKSVVTSGNYERYFIANEKKFHHIIDPITGYPSNSKIISATIISEHSIDGDGLSTGIYIMGLHKSISLIESIKNVDAIFITEDKEIYITSGIMNHFKLTNKEFVYKELNEI